MGPLLRPLVVMAGLYLAGTLAALRLAPGPAVALIAACVGAGAAVAGCGWSRRTGRVRHTTLLAAAFTAAGVAGGASYASAVVDHCLARLPDGARVTVDGVLGAASIPTAAGAHDLLLPLEAARIHTTAAACDGGVRVRLPDRGPALRAGSRVHLRGEWIRGRPAVDPTPWPRPPGRAGFLVADSLVRAVAPRPGTRPLLWLRGHAEWTLLRLFPRHFPLAEALLLGRRERIDERVERRFADSGLTHLLAISGSHVALLAGSFLVIGAVLRQPRGRTAGAALILVWSYLAMIGAPASALRAGVMLTLALLAVRLQRPASVVPMMAAAAVAIVAVSPGAVLDVGLQLSFAGVAGILMSRGAVRGVRRRLRSPAARVPAEALVVSAAAFAATAPIAVYHFGTFAPIAVVANLPAVPLSGLALTGVAASLAVEPAAPGLARLLADGASVALELLDRVAGVAAAVPFGHTTLARPYWLAWVLLAAGTATAALLRSGRPWTRAAVAVAGVAGAALAWTAPAARGGALEIHFLDVGQGDAVAIRSPAGRWILVDAGPRTAGFDAGERRVLPFLRRRGVSRLELLVLTHPDADHIGGAPAVLRAIEVGRVIEPGLPVGKGLYLELLDEVGRRAVPWSAARAGRVASVDGVELHFLWPDSVPTGRPPEANALSAVLQLRFGRFAALLPGDAPEEVERTLAERIGARLHSQVLKAGHHGSATSTSEPFLRAVNPAMVVISAGRRNRYGHPSPEVMARLARRGLPVARTDLDGTVTVRVDPADGRLWQWVRR